MHAYKYMYIYINHCMHSNVYIHTSSILSTCVYIYMAMHVYILSKEYIILSIYYIYMLHAYFFKEMSVSSISILTYYLSKLAFHTHSTKTSLDQVTKDFILFVISGKCDFTLFYLLEALGNNDYSSSLPSHQ